MTHSFYILGAAPGYCPCLAVGTQGIMAATWWALLGRHVCVCIYVRMRILGWGENVHLSKNISLTLSLNERSWVKAGKVGEVA